MNEAVGDYEQPEDEVLTLQEVSEFLKMGTRTLYKHIRAGLLVASNVSTSKQNEWRILRSDVDAFLVQTRHQPPPKPPPKKRGRKRKPVIKDYLSQFQRSEK